MTCDACDQAAVNPHSGLYRSGCRECTARALSRSPEIEDRIAALAMGTPFETSMAAQQFDPAYLAALKAEFGSEWADGHRRVKAWATRAAP